MIIDQRLGPGLREALGDIRPLGDKIGRESAAGGVSGSASGSPSMYLAITPASTVLAMPRLFITRGVRLERIAAVESAGLHGVDVLAHIELIDGVIAVFQADLGENALGGVEVRRARRRHQLETLEILQRA